MDEEQQPFTPQDGPSSGKHSQPTTQLCETSQAEKPSDMAEEQAEGAPEWLGGILHDLLNTEVKTRNAVGTKYAPLQGPSSSPEPMLADTA